MPHSNVNGYLSLVLHAHLPFVRHPEHPVFLEENWLFEAMFECYIPMSRIFRKLIDDGVDFRITMSMSPTLCEMLTDELLQERFCKRLDSLIELAEKEVERTASEPEFNRTAIFYSDRLKAIRHYYEEDLKRDLLGAFKSFQEAGKLQIIACAATHAILPLIRSPRIVRAHIRTARQNYRRHFGRDPEGIWLPECAYYPGLDEELAAEDIRFFFMDSHGILFAEPRPRYGTFAPVYCRSQTAAFGRDIESSKQVWSAHSGYPGDSVYREFYRDLGYDAEQEYIAPYLQTDGSRHDLGLKYYRVTGDVPLHDKQPYDRQAALHKAEGHAGNFMFNRQTQAHHIREHADFVPLVTAPFDAELFGHWWYEGPEFIDALLRKMATEQNEVELITPSEYLDRHPTLQVVEPSASSWGDKGYFEVWVNGGNDWIYPHLHEAEERMCQMVDDEANKNELTARAIAQAGRELLLAQASDWSFIMTTGTMVDYAQSRIESHIKRFNEIFEMVRAGNIDISRLAEIENQDNIFPELTPDVFR